MLVFHIGPPKTATTLLQYQIFKPALKNAFFSIKRNDNVRRLVKLIQNDDGATEETFDQITKWLTRRSSKPLTVVSNENISSRADGFWDGSGPSPDRVATLLAKLSDAAGFPRSDVRIILGVRRQDQMLASRYAQGASVKEHYSQDGFEARVNDILNLGKALPGHQWLYYDKVLDAFESTFGHNNVLSLSVPRLEQNPEIEIARLGQFCKSDFSAVLAAAIASGKIRSVNRKSTDIEEWMLGNTQRLVLHPNIKARILSHFAGSNFTLFNKTCISLVSECRVRS